MQKLAEKGSGVTEDTKQRMDLIGRTAAPSGKSKKKEFEPILHRLGQAEDLGSNEQIDKTSLKLDLTKIDELNTDQELSSNPSERGAALKKPVRKNAAGEANENADEKTISEKEEEGASVAGLLGGPSRSGKGRPQELPQKGAQIESLDDIQELKSDFDISPMGREDANSSKLSNQDFDVNQLLQQIQSGTRNSILDNVDEAPISQGHTSRTRQTQKDEPQSSGQQTSASQLTHTQLERPRANIPDFNLDADAERSPIANFRSEKNLLNGQSPQDRALFSQAQTRSSLQRQAPTANAQADLLAQQAPTANGDLMIFSKLDKRTKQNLA